MTDEEIVELFWQRNQSAIKTLQEKYGKYCYSISYAILQNHQDAEECINDSYLAVWNTIPPDRPKLLPGFIGKIVRNKSIDSLKRQKRVRRGGGEITVLLDELGEIVSSNKTVESEIEGKFLAEKLTVFLMKQKGIERDIFLRRYWYGDRIVEIAKRYSFSESKIKSILFRTRKRLKKYLEKEELI